MPANKAASISKAAWARFLYYLYKHSGWLSQRNERYAYSDESRWVRSLSLELDFECLVDHFRSIVLHEAESNENLQVDASIVVPIPIMELSKTVQPISMDAVDRFGHPISLSSNAQSAHYCMQILVGALYEEDNLSFDDHDPLLFALAEWFRKQDLPQDENGVIEYYDDPQCLDRLLHAFIIDLRSLGEEMVGDTPRWDSDTISAAEARFRELYGQSNILKYFVRNYAYRRHIFAPIAFDELRYSTLRCEYTAARDVVGEGQRRRYRLFTSHVMAAARLRVQLPFEIYSVGSAETSNYTVEAPSGMFFSNQPAILFDPVGDGSTLKKSEPFYILEDVYRDPIATEAHEDQDVPSIEARGFIARNIAQLSARFPWTNNNMDRARSLPINGCPDRRYSMVFSLSPQCSRTMFGQLFFILFSLVAFLVAHCSEASGHFKVGDLPDMLTVLLMVAAIVVACFSTLRFNATYFEKITTLLPNLFVLISASFDMLLYLCVSVNGFLHWISMPIRLLPMGAHGSFFAFGLLLCLVLSLCQIATMFVLRHRSKMPKTPTPAVIDVIRQP